MARFLTDLDVRQVLDSSSDKRGTWTLLAPLAFQSDIADRIFIAPKGMLTDFASVPKIPVVFLLMGNSAHAAAVIHDLLYTTHEVDKATADKVFEEACLAIGIYSWKAKLFWLGVWFGGSGPWNAAGQPQPQPVAELLTQAP